MSGQRKGEDAAGGEPETSRRRTPGVPRDATHGLTGGCQRLRSAVPPFRHGPLHLFRGTDGSPSRRNRAGRGTGNSCKPFRARGCSAAGRSRRGTKSSGRRDYRQRSEQVRRKIRRESDLIRRLVAIRRPDSGSDKAMKTSYGLDTGPLTSIGNSDQSPSATPLAGRRSHRPGPAMPVCFHRRTQSVNVTASAEVRDLVTRCYRNTNFVPRFGWPIAATV